MVHRTQTTNGIWTNEVVYRTSPLGNLDRNIWIEDTAIPLQEGFDSDCQRGLPVAVADKAAFFAFEQRIVGTMSCTQSTAAAAPFARVPTVHDVQSNIIVEASLLEDLPKLIERNTHDSPVESPADSPELLEIFYSDVRIKSAGNLDYLFDNLPEVGLDKVSFVGLDATKLFLGFQRLKQCSSLHDFFSPSPYVLAKIGLIKNLSFWRDDAGGKMLGIDIDSEDILSLRSLLLFGKVCDNLQVVCQAEGLAGPAAFYEVLKSLVVPVLLYWDGNPF